ncbi:MAG: kelch repeat-containing protein, partial [Chloroflexota bacterium]
KRTSGPTGLVEIYEVDNDRWREGPGKPTPVVDVQAITINDKIYVAGGCNDEVEATDVLEILDTSTNLWTAGPPLPTPLCGYAATADAQNLYIIGGWDGNNYHDVVYMLNIDDEETMQWRILETPYPHKTGYAGAAFLAGEIYVAGGLKGDQELADVHILNLQTEEWRKGPSLQSPRAGLGLINLNDTLFAIGGGWSSNLRYNERLIAGQSEWEQLTTPYSKEWRNFGIAQNGKDIIIAGGWNGDYINLLVTYEGDFRVFIPVLQ